MDYPDSLTPYGRFVLRYMYEVHIARDDEVTAAYEAGKVSAHDACVQTAERLRAIEKGLPVPPVVTDDIAREPCVVMSPRERWGNEPEPTADREAERMAAVDAFQPLRDQLEAIEKRYLSTADKKARNPAFIARRPTVERLHIGAYIDLRKQKG